jgi:hypothetical protein
MNDYIPEDWIRKYVDSLITVAKSLDDSSIMKQAIIIRVECILDMVEAFRERNNEKSLP